MPERGEELAALMTAEQGKPLRAARNEVGYAADFLLWFAEEAKRVYGQTIPSSRAEQRFWCCASRSGVCAAITPWNYPVSMLTRKVGPALAAGCTVVLKPAEQTPLCAVEVFEIFDEAGLPAGVVNLVTASDPVPIGERAADEPGRAQADLHRLDRGRQALMAQAAPTDEAGVDGARRPRPLHRVRRRRPGPRPRWRGHGEGAQHRPGVHLPQPPLRAAAIVDTFVEALAGRVAKMQAGAGFTDGVQIGPLVDDAALDKVDRQVHDAVAKGARVVTGGARLRTATWPPATSTPRPCSPASRPNGHLPRGDVRPGRAAHPLRHEDEASAMANDTEYGLACYVYTNDLGRAWRAIEALRFGIVGVNDINPTAAAAPSAGSRSRPRP